MSSNKKEFTFKKFQGAENYKQWSRDITFTLQDAKLWGHIDRSAREPPELSEILDNDKDKKERIYQQWDKIKDFDLDVIKTPAKISKMCSVIV